MIFNNIIFDLPFWRQSNNRSQSYCPAWNILKTKKYMDVKTTVFKPGAADHWRQQPWEMGNKCCRPCVCLLTVWELPGRPSCRRQEPSPWVEGIQWGLKTPSQRDFAEHVPEGRLLHRENPKDWSRMTISWGMWRKHPWLMKEPAKMSERNSIQQSWRVKNHLLPQDTGALGRMLRKVLHQSQETITTVFPRK